MAKKKKRKKGIIPSCTTCENCIPIGEGDHICMEVEADDGTPAIMPISDYSPTDDYLKCGGTLYVER